MYNSHKLKGDDSPDHFVRSVREEGPQEEGPQEGGLQEE